MPILCFQNTSSPPQYRSSITEIADSKMLIGDTGFLGPATSPVVADSTDAKGFHNDYKNDHIYWSPDSGVHTITSPIYDKWMTHGGPKRAASLTQSRTKHLRPTTKLASTTLVSTLCIHARKWCTPSLRKYLQQMGSRCQRARLWLPSQ